MIESELELENQELGKINKNLKKDVEKIQKDFEEYKVSQY